MIFKNQLENNSLLTLKSHVSRINDGAYIWVVTKNLNKP